MSEIKLITGFTIKLASKTKKTKTTDSYTRISKKLEAVVILDKDVFKARLTSTPVEESLQEFRLLSLTPNSFKLQDKKYVFLKNKDQYNHIQVVIRNEFEAHNSPGLDNQYNALIENMVIEGYIVKKDNKFYFDYKKLVAFNEKSNRIVESKINITDE